MDERVATSGTLGAEVAMSLKHIPPGVAAELSLVAFTHGFVCVDLAPGGIVTIRDKAGALRRFVVDADSISEVDVAMGTNEIIDREGCSPGGRGLLFGLLLGRRSS